MRANQRTANAVMSKAYNELQSRATGPLKILQVYNKTFVIDENGIRETILIDRATNALMMSHTSPTRANLQRCAKTLPQDQDNTAQGQTEYVVGHIVRHIGKMPNVKFVIRRYGYGPEQDMVEPEAPVPTRLITLYRLKKTKNQSQYRELTTTKK